MKSAGGLLAAHIGGEVTTLCTCWKVQRKDGGVLGFTDHPSDITYDDGGGVLTYQAATGYTRSAIKSTRTLSVDNLELESVFDTAAISEEDLRAGRYDGATVDMFLVNYADLSQGHIKLRKGWIGEVEIRDGTYVAEFRGLTQLLQMTVGALYLPACPADLGDARCKVNLAPLTETAAVAAVSDRRTFQVCAPGSATFGRTAQGAVSVSFPPANNKSVSRFTLGGAGYVQSLWFYASAAVSAAKVKGVVYADASGAPAALVAATSELAGVALGWNRLAFAAPVSLAAGAYHLGVIADTQVNSYGASGGTNSYNVDTYADGPANPFGTASSSAYEKPLYARYTAALTPELTGATGYYDGGLVTFTSGDNAGVRMEVASWDAGTGELTLFLPMPYPIAPGDTFTITPGCNKTFEVCKAKFSNGKNFRGFPDIPGTDQMLEYP